MKANRKTVQKRLLSLFFAIVMLFSVSVEGLGAIAADSQEDAILLPAQDLPDMDYVEGMPYIGIATAEVSVEETGSYLLTVRRTGDVSIGSTAELRTVDVSACYGLDYKIDDPALKTEVLPQTETLVKRYGNEANRLSAAQTLTELGERISDSIPEEENAEAAGSAVTTEPESELARLKMEQTGLPVRQTAEDSEDMLPQELKSLLTEATDIAELLDASSVTKLTFAPGETEKTVRFCVLEDAESEGQEMINFLLACPDDDTAMIESARSVSVIIEDDEPEERSVVSFTKASYSADSQKATLTLKREGAEYSYASVGVRTVDGTAVGGVNYEPLGVTVNFAQFQTVATVEIPVVPGRNPTEFSAELYDLKGIDPGEIVTAKVTVPALTAAARKMASVRNANLKSTSDKIRVWIDGMPRECSVGSFDGNGWASVTCTYDGRTFEVGKYRLATALGYNPWENGKGSKTHQIEGDHYHLKVYNSYYHSEGTTGASFRVFSSEEPSRYYSSMYVDYETFSDSEASRFSLYSVQGRNFSFVTGKRSRTVGLGVTIPNFDNGYPSYGEEYCVVSVEKTQKKLRNPDANVYGFIVLYQAFDVSVDNPDPLEYATGTFDENGNRVTEQRLPAKTHLASPARTYAKQFITIGEEPADEYGCIYGELKGYEITPQGGSTFFYATNSKTIRLDADLIKLINDHSGNMMPDLQQMEGQGFRDFHTSIRIKPVYGYKDAAVELLAPDAGGVVYKDKDLQAAWTGSRTLSSVFHVGDKLNPAVTPVAEILFYTGYWRYAYKNPGDTEYDTIVSGHVQADTTPVTVLTRARTVFKPVLESVDNFIEIRMDADAKKFFAISGLVPQDRLTAAFMKGKNVLNCGTDAAPATKPAAGQAYTVLLTKTDLNDGTWRPKITIRQKGVTVNGFAADFVAADNAPGNVIEVTAEKFDPQKLQYFAVKGKAVYQSYSVRPSSSSLVGVPAVGAIVSAGAESVKNTVTVRMNSPAGDDGTFTVAGLRALQGDTVSLLIDNDGIRQAAYVTLNADRTQQMTVATFVPSTDPDFEFDVAQKTETVILQTAPATAMPIRTGYSPYVTYVSYGYADADIGSTEPNEIPVKAGTGSLILSVCVNLNGIPSDDVKVTAIKRDFNGNESVSTVDTKSSVPWETDCWEASFAENSLHDGDEFWVQLTVNGKAYPRVKTGLSCYKTAEAPVEQRFIYDLPTPYEDLPIIKTLSGTLDSGVCNWQTIYADKNNPGSSPYAQLITMTVSAGNMLDPNDALAKANKLLSLERRQYTASDLLPDGFTSDSDLDDERLGDIVDQVNQQVQRDDGYTGATNLSGDALAKFKEPQFSGKIEFLLQLEYDYDPVEAEHFYAGGQYLISFTFNVKSTIYWSVMGVPMYVNLNGSTSVDFAGRYATSKERLSAEELGREADLAKAIPTEWPYFDWTFTATAQPGVGIYGIAGVRGYVSFTIMTRANAHGSSLGGSVGTFSGGFGVDLLIFSFTKAWPTTLWKSGVFSKPSSKNAALRANAAQDASVSVRAFDAGEERAQNALLRSTLTPQTKTTLIDGAMEYVRPRLVDLGDGRTMLLFLRKTDGDGRDQNNAATLVYAIRRADGTWEKDAYGNIVSTVVETDGQADSAPAAYRVGDKVYIAWTNAEVVGVDSFENASRSLKNSQIRLASYDIPTGAVSEIFAVTDDDFVNSYAHIIERQGHIVLYYFKRDIGQAQKIDDLPSLTGNYNTWALRVFDPATGSFIGGEELLDVKHPTAIDPLVFNLETGQYAYTDSNGATKKYGVISYITDTDGNLSTAGDRELWAIVRNQTDGKAYYPVKIDSGKASLTDARLTEQNGELYLTWLTDGATINTLCASEVWEYLDSVFGSEDGAGDQTVLELIRGLSKEQIGAYRWNQLPYLAQPEELRDSELYAIPANLAFERFPVIKQDLSDGSDDADRMLGSHRIVAGADGNLYYFWTEPSEDGMGQELYGAAFYTGPAENGEDGRRTWSKPVQLTDYGLAIDELAIEVNADNGATMIANLFEQFPDDREGVAFGPHKLTEIGFNPGSSLVIGDRGIRLSDEYPVPGETVTADFDVTNLGLLPAERFRLTLDGETEELDQTVLPGESLTITAEKVAGDGALSFTVKAQELAGTQLLTAKAGCADTATVETKTGWALDFGYPEIVTYNEAADQIGPLLRELTDKTGREWNDEEILSRIAASVDPKYTAILNTLNCAPENRRKADLYAVVPVTNVGNQPAENVAFKAVEMHKELKESEGENIYVTVEGDTVGEWTLDAAPVKTLGENGVETKTVYVAIPLVGFNMEEDMDELGRVEIKITAEKDGDAIDGALNASRQLTENVLLQIDGGAEEIALNAGETVTLDVLEYPFDSLKRLSYEIEDGAVAAVTQDGCITGLTAGTTVITVRDVEQPRLTKQIKVTVTSADPGYTSPSEYRITKGADAEWMKGGEKGVVITVERSDADDTCFDHFTGVLIDGKPLEKDVDYTAAEGSFAITLKAEALEKLSVGEHTVTIDFDDGKAETKLTVKAASQYDPTSPQTGDNSHLDLRIALTIISFCGLTATLFIGKKRAKNR